MTEVREKQCLFRTPACADVVSYAATAARSDDLVFLESQLNSLARGRVAVHEASASCLARLKVSLESHNCIQYTVLVSRCAFL